LYGVAWSDDSYCSRSTTAAATTYRSTYYRYFAACGGRYVSIYEVGNNVEEEEFVARDDDGGGGGKKTTKKGSGGTSGTTKTKNTPTLMLRQSYSADGDDDDGQQDEEDFFRCVFVGRRRGGGVQAATEANDEEEEDCDDDAASPPSAKRARRCRQSSSSKPSSSQLLACAGATGTIRILDPLQKRLVATLIGHGDEVYDLQVSPTDEHVLLSCSKDESIRVWCLRHLSLPSSSSSLAAAAANTALRRVIVGGPAGHTDSIISVAWHRSGTRIASGGTDTSVKLWDVTDAVAVVRDTDDVVDVDVDDENEESDKVNEPSSTEGRQIWRKEEVTDCLPIFSTNQIHLFCVDCVEFVGDLVLSKSVEDVIELWAPILEDNNKNGGDDDDDSYSRRRRFPPLSDYVHLRSFRYSNGSAWFMRFAVDPSGTVLAVGDTDGHLYLWDIAATSTESSSPRYKQKLPLRKGCIRSIAFSPRHQDDDDVGSTLVAVTDECCIGFAYSK